MAITLVTEPTTGAPITASDYTAQNGLISANQVPMLSVLSSWESTTAAPTIKQNAFIRHAGNTYQVDTADETISGAPVSGINYIELTLSGSTLVAAWVTSLTGYAYNPVYGGIYNGSGNQLIRDVCYLDGSDYFRGIAYGEDFNSYRLSDGTFKYKGAIMVETQRVSFFIPNNTTTTRTLSFSSDVQGIAYINADTQSGVESNGNVRDVTISGSDVTIKVSNDQSSSSDTMVIVCTAFIEA